MYVSILSPDISGGIDDGHIGQSCLTLEDG